MSKPKILYLAYKLFNQILENEPMMTGAYQWIRVFNSDYKNWKELEQTKSELEKYDLIHINGDPMDLRLIHEVRFILGESSSTKIVVNQDHAPELWDVNFPFITEVRRALMDADYIFATSPCAKNLLDLLMEGRKKIHLIPHPCETHVLKRIDSFIRSEHLLVFWHRYDHPLIVPWLATKNLGISVSLVGYLQDQDPNFKITMNVPNWRIISYLRFPDFIKLMKEAIFGYDPFNSYSYGRVLCDAACLRLPMVCSSFNYSAKILYPFTSVNPFDAKKSRELLKKLMEDEKFREKVVDYAYEHVEFFSHKASRERFLAMIEDA